MKATLESRKSVRLNWLKLDNVKFTKQRTTEWTYTLDNVGENQHYLDIKSQYVFSPIAQPIPKTNIIIFEQELPQSYTRTDGNIGDKFATEKEFDPDVKVTDRIVKLDQGEEKITTKPVLPHETAQYKEIQIHERTDKVYRKIAFKNETSQAVPFLEPTFIENKEIRFISSNPAPSKRDAPEYKWNLSIPAEGIVTIELTLESYTKTTYKIEREKLKAGIYPASAAQINANPNDFDENQDLDGKK